MSKEKILNQYAIEKGWDDFNHLMLDDMFEGDLDNIMKTINAVTDLIQEELKKKVSVIAVDKFLGCNINSWEDIENSILNTEIL